ncbi:DUF1775 domain-containing protein [Micromonospora sp. IBHARD004]|uniref:DUF1775 domain-containing protein n=1 Tax=Micromonospora sp. IBHARD004 TaxID=3457764 RepID=UPI00405914C4
MNRPLLTRAATIAATVAAITLGEALQTYSDGDVVRWIEEPTSGAEPEHPAPVLKLAKKDAATPAAAPVALAATSNDSVKDSNNGTAYGIAGILLGLAGLVAGLLAYRRAAQAR